MKYILLSWCIVLGFIALVSPPKWLSSGTPVIKVETKRSFDRNVHEHIRPDGTRCVIYASGQAGGISCDFTNKEGVEHEGRP